MKRGVFWIVLVILFSFSVSGLELNITLDKQEFGPNEPIQGKIIIKSSEPIEKTEELIISVGDSVGKKTIDEIFSPVQNKVIVPAGFNTLEENRNTALLNFERNGTKYIMSDLTLGGVCSKDVFDSIESFEVTLNGKVYEGIYPKSVRLDVGNDKKIEYTFKGNPLENYIQLNSSYINPNVAPITMEAGYGEIFCEEVELMPTTHYKVSSTLKKKVSGARILASVVGEEYGGPIGDTSELTGCLEGNNPEVPSCCELRATNAMSEISCVLPKEINDKQKGYVCVGAQGDGVEEEVMSINIDSDSSLIKGYHYGNNARFDAYIKGAYRDFEKEIRSPKTIESNPEDFEDPYAMAFDEYIRDNDLIIPIAVSSESKGRLEISNFNLKIRCPGVFTVGNFNVMDLGGERISYNGSIEIPLENFGSLRAPLIIGENYTLNVRLLGTSIQSNEITIVSLPVADIQASKLSLNVNEDVVFSGGESQSPEGNQISVYQWNFGDGSAEKTGKYVSYKYPRAGNYTVKLTVTDDKGKRGVATEILSVEEEKIEEIPGKIGEVLNKINIIKETIAKDELIKEVSGILGINDKINNAYANLTVIQSEISSEIQKDNRSLEKIIELKVRYEDKLNEIPLEFNIEKIDFEAKVKDLGSIPDANQLKAVEVDKFKERLLTYQLRDNVNIEGTAFEVKITMLSKNVQNFVLVKKVITGGGTIYEIIPPETDIEKILTPDYEVVQGKIHKWTGKAEIKYLLENIELIEAAKIKTILMPLSLEDIEVSTLEKREFEDIFECGDGICKVGVEDELSCPQDCKSKFPFGVIIVLVIILIFGVFYFNFYKGPGNFHDLFKKKPKPEELFSNMKAYQSLVDFAKNSRAKGQSDYDIKSALLKKKWNIQQVEAVIEASKKK